MEDLKSIERKDKITQVLGTCLGLILVPVLIGVGMSLSKKHEEKYPWKASFFYKETGDIIDSKDVKTLDECRNWALKKGETYKEGAWDYSCGRGCDFGDEKIQGGKETHIYKCAELTK